MNIAIVEDNIELRGILSAGLRHFGHQVREAANGRELDGILRADDVEIVILDLGLPDEDGISIARRLRRQAGPKLGIVMVTARGSIDERVTGLETGADLYFVKPVDIRELEAAIRSLYRRIREATPAMWRFNSKTSTLITPSGASILLTALECLLMQKLAERPGENVSRKEIFQMFKQDDDQYADKRLEALVSRLRAKVRLADPSADLPLRARHNFGYAFLAEIEASFQPECP